MYQLVEIQYLPCIDWFKKAIQLKHVEIEACETFQKMSFRNRCAVAGSNGIIFLSIPLKNGREQNARIMDTQMSGDNTWRNQHWKTIISCYNKSPFFEYYAEAVKELLFQEERNLFQYNVSIISSLFKMLNTNVKISFTESFVRNYDGELIEDNRNKWLPKNYNSLEKDWQPTYPQVFDYKTGFNQNLSILDLLFCEGPNGRLLLEKA